MKDKDVKVGHIYYANFNPVRRGEFPDNHMAIVISKNNDNITYIVIPLTSNSEDVHRNKIPLDSLSKILPKHLRNKKSFAVIDQVRTINLSRFSELFENYKTYDVTLPKSDFERVVAAAIRFMLKDLDDSSKTRILQMSNPLPTVPPKKD